MRKLERKIIGLSVLAGLFFWVMDAVLDYYSGYFSDISFIRLLLFDAPPHPLYIRPFIFILFIISGLIFASIISKNKIATERYQQLFNNIDDPILLFPLDDREWMANFNEVNEAAAKKMGYSRAELLQLSPDKLSAPEKLPEIPSLWGTLKADKHILFEIILMSKSGARIPVEINAHIVRLEDKPHVLAIVRDIRERKLVEEEIHRLASFPQLDPNPILEVDVSGRITYFNIAAQETLKRLGVKEMEAFLPDDLSEFLKTARRGGVNQFYREKGIKGALFAELIHFVPQYNVMRLYPGDITVRRQAENALQESEQQLRALTSQLLSIQETERRRISCELHDELGQALIYLKLQMGAVRAKMRKDQVSLKSDCEYLLHYLDGIIENVRRLSWDLSPTVLEEMGLSAAIKYWLEEFGKYYHVGNLTADIEEIDDLFSSKVQLNIYRIFQECLTNIGRHAQATQISLEVRKQNGRVAFIIKDNGQGFNVKTALARESSTKGIGLATMAERVRMVGGSLDIHSHQGAGTQITFTIPTDARRKPEDVPEDAPLPDYLSR
jgi:PAS domain S-box-containing protein